MIEFLAYRVEREASSSPRTSTTVERIPHPTCAKELFRLPLLRPVVRWRPAHTLARDRVQHRLTPIAPCMHNFILDAVALPHKPQNRIWNSFNRYLTEAYLRGMTKRSMCSPEQRNNLYLLADQTVAFDIPGDFVELGCYEGQTTRVIASVIEHHQVDRTLHVYDNFQYDASGDGDVRARLELNFRKSGLRNWLIHDGDFEVTLPEKLPPTIAFAHIDCGVGDLPEFHCKSMMRCLNEVYPRMGPGSIGVLMDYHDPDRTVSGWDCNPGVKMACDHFFKTKPECMQILYGGKFSHAFFRKAL